MIDYELLIKMTRVANILIIRMNITVKVKEAWWWRMIARCNNTEDDVREVDTKIGARKQEPARTRFTPRQVPQTHPWRPRVCPLR